MRASYKFFVTIKINCAGTIQRVSIPIGIRANSYQEAKDLLKGNTNFSIEEPIELITEL